MKDKRSLQENSAADGRRLRSAIAWLGVAAILFSVPLRAAGPVGAPQPAGTASPGTALEQQWGVKVLGVRLSAGGYMLDFRYRVLDPVKARSLFDMQVKPCLIDQTTGARMMVPAPPKIGALRSSAKTIVPDRNYFMMFANPAQYVKAGSKVSVEIGAFKVENLVVKP